MTSFLCLFQGSLGSDPRPTRMTQFIEKNGQVTACCLEHGNALSSSSSFTHLTRRKDNLAAKGFRALDLLSRHYEKDVWNGSVQAAFNELQHKKFDLILCHDLVLLPLACAIRDSQPNKGKTKIIFDAREFYPRQFEHSALWRLLFAGFNHYLCKTYLAQADIVFTVSPGLAAGYLQDYGVPCQLLPSTSPLHAITPHTTKPGAIRLIHHGGASAGRQLELMIQGVLLANEHISLDMMLVQNNPGYYNKLVTLAAGNPRIRFIPPVPLEKIVETIAIYDLGIFLLPPNTFNHKHTLPNKFFEFIQARLGIVVGPSPDMASIVQEYELGIITPDFTPQAFAHTINTLTPQQVDTFKNNAHAAAKIFCWETNEQKLAKAIAQIMPKR